MNLCFKLIICVIFLLILLSRISPDYFLDCHKNILERHYEIFSGIIFKKKVEEIIHCGGGVSTCYNANIWAHKESHNNTVCYFRSIYHHDSKASTEAELYNYDINSHVDWLKYKDSPLCINYSNACTNQRFYVIMLSFFAVIFTFVLYYLF